jgi:glucokinase
MEAVERGAESSLQLLMDADPLSITAQVVYEAAKAGDSLAREVVQDTARILGAAIANLVNVFNPEVVVVCGGVTLAGESLFAPLRREVTRRAFRPAVEVCRIVPGALTGSAGVYGAARSFLDTRAG